MVLCRCCRCCVYCECPVDGRMLNGVHVWCVHELSLCCLRHFGGGLCDFYATCVAYFRRLRWEGWIECLCANIDVYSLARCCEWDGHFSFHPKSVDLCVRVCRDATCDSRIPLYICVILLMYVCIRAFWRGCRVLCSSYSVHILREWIWQENSLFDEIFWIYVCNVCFCTVNGLLNDDCLLNTLFLLSQSTLLFFNIAKWWLIRILNFNSIMKLRRRELICETWNLIVSFRWCWLESYWEESVVLSFCKKIIHWSKFYAIGTPEMILHRSHFKPEKKNGNIKHTNQKSYHYFI